MNLNSNEASPRHEMNLMRRDIFVKYFNYREAVFTSRT